ncbi:serine--tRNA ligase [Pelagibacterium lacus]|uniref:Serine--tRNA ligase n=1 Tax=Pelagibacterium lacus TaxID=2282655 RepID=A0A369W419_9HYPH|nr:serine--tRNA ligase [Pelagibacterium lacus]RDE09298.1 serine--tRNA ligase [Pelagibacterium lacus]
MFDIKWISANPEAFDAALATRGAEPLAASLIALDDDRRSVVAEMNAAQEKRNGASKLIGQAKAQKDEARAQELMAEVAGLKETLGQLEARERQLTEDLRAALSVIPNLPAQGVPVGEDETGNVPYFRTGESAETRPAKPNLAFAPKEHYELGEAMGGMDFETAAKLSGSRFVVLKGQIARLERAIGQFMLDLHVNEHGYTEVVPPYLVRDEAMYGTSQLPKFDGDFFFTPHGEGRLALIPTAEVPLTNLVREALLTQDELPLRFAALTPCFRSEAGSAGRDTRGMLRQHQFNKVEMVSITTPDQSDAEHERMLACAEEVLKRLGIHYRVMQLCTGDMGFGARRTYDIEAWLPGQNTYREISSVSVCGDFQARRMDARYRDANGKPQYVHTLNGSGVAVGRALIAVMENYQNEDGSISIPAALQPYMGAIEKIGG